MMLDYKANWVPVPQGEGNRHFARYTGISLEEWHRSHGLYDDSEPGPPPALRA
jgi:hypothetical protein